MCTQVQKTVMVTEEQAEWLEENGWFNLSGAVRQMLDDRIEQEQPGDQSERVV